MKSSARRLVSASAWGITCFVVLAACWDPATLKASATDLTGTDGGVDAAADASSDGAVACSAPGLACGPTCVDTMNDPLNCGGCGIACPIGPPPPPACVGTRATLFGPGVCTAGACTFLQQTMDCAPLNRTCIAGQCPTCIAGFQDNDGNGTCTPDCATAALTCSGHGACSDVTGAAACVCTPGSGFTGTNCQTSVLPATGLAAHYDAREFASLTLGAGNTVTAWADLSGNGRTLAPASAPPVYSVALINGRPAVDFVGAGMVTAAFPLTTDVTVFAAIQYGSPGQWGAIAHHGSRDDDWSMEQSGFKTADVMHWQSVNDNAGVELTFLTGTSYVVAGRFTGSGVGALRYFSSTSTAGGTVSATGTGSTIVTGSKAMYVGASDANELSNASIGELIYYTRSLSDAERDQIIAYLKLAWGI